MAALIQRIALLDSIYATSKLLDVYKEQKSLQTELDFIMPLNSFSDQGPTFISKGIK